MSWIRRLLHGNDQDRLTRARREQQEVVRRGKEREPMINKLKQYDDDNHFAEGFHIALGGDT